MKFITYAILLLTLIIVSACNSRPETVTPTVAQTSEQPAKPTPPVGTTGNTLKTTQTIDPQKSPIIISQVTHSGDLETIFVTNVSDQSQDITGYTLFLPTTGETYNFPDTKLPSGASAKVYNGPNAKNQTDGATWRAEPALVMEDDEILLLNRGSRLIWTYVYYP